MDRPEDAEPNPVTGTVYVMLTNNTRRKADQVNTGNPRPKNKHGHILELIPPGHGKDADHAALQFKWEVPLMAGNPANAADGAKYHADLSANDWLSTPDNCAVNTAGRLWIATDGAPKSGITDGVWATDVEGDGRMLTKRFSLPHAAPSYVVRVSRRMTGHSSVPSSIRRTRKTRPSPIRQPGGPTSRRTCRPVRRLWLLRNWMAA
jgi:secreted PhoX family phosphatase